MTDERNDLDFERRLRRSLEQVAPPADPRLAERLLARTADEPQRRRWSLFLGVGPALALAAVVVLAVVAGFALSVLPRNVGVDPGPSPTPSVTPTPTARSTASPSPSPSAPTPTPSPEGRACRNEADGFEVVYPADWFTNEEIEQDSADPIPACRYFGAEPMEIRPNTRVPPTVAIIFRVETEPSPDPSPAELIDTGDATVDGRPATVSEWEFTEDSFGIPGGARTTIYRIELADGSTLVASTNPGANGDYDEHRAVLEQMIESLTLD